MMASEAITRIKASRDYKYSHYSFTDDTGKAFDMAIKALEKQIAKSPELWGACLRCPNCGVVQIIFDNYCPACGQRIKESDT